MTSFGSQLRAAREASGWSIEYVSFKSKIQPNIIESLESDDYVLFSSASYVKSFLRKYSDFLDLDLEDEISDLEIIGYNTGSTFTGCEGVKENLEMTHFSKKNQRYRKAEKSKGSPVFLVGSVVVLLSALAGFYYMGSQANSPEAGARDILQEFESKRSVFSRDREAKERLVSEKRPIAPIKTSISQDTPLASTKSTLTQGSMPQPLQQIDPMDEFDAIEKPDVSTFNVPELDSSADLSRAPAKVAPREINPLFDY
ncbi:MAG: helix-turn-helix domain-containing protein [Verrucomicrobiales bacterium]|nr:helix-turn-helix domain-containing protein [Verrucomicrobiales bacterium]